MRTSTTASSGSCSATSASSVSASPALPTTSWPASSSSPARPSRSSTVSSAITIRMAAPRRSAFPRPARRVDRERPALGGDAVVHARAPRRAPPTPSSAIVIRSTPFARAVSHDHARRRRVLDGVGERLAGDEVRGRLDLRRRAVGRRGDVDRDRGAAREVGERGGQALVQPRRADAGGDRAQVGDRGRDLVDGGVERRDEHLRLARERALQAPQHDAERDQPLLRAVVQVALEPAPLLVAGLGDPRARGLHLGQLQPQLDAQAGELDRHRGGVEHAAQQVRRGRRVQEHAEVAADHRALAPVVGQLDRAPVAVGVGPGLGQLEDERGVAVAERERDHRADVLRLGAPVADLVEEVAQHPHGVEAAAREAAVDQRLQPVAQRQEGERGGDRRQRGGQLRVADDAARPAARRARRSRPAARSARRRPACG